MKIIMLGSGSSGGVPLITGDWGDCDPTNPKNYRTRASALVQVNGLNILIDTPPDLRQQLLANNIDRIDAVLYTHSHADHIFGIDELRQIAILKNKKPIPCYAEPQMLAYLKMTFSYIFQEKDPLYPPFLEAIAFEGPFEIGGVPIIPYFQNHGSQDSFGFRIGDFAYSTDFKDIPVESLEKLQHLKCWIAGCLRYEPHLTHAHYDSVLSFVQDLKPQQTFFTHMTPLLDYETLLRLCPPGVQPGYDGLTIEVN